MKKLLLRLPFLILLCCFVNTNAQTPCSGGLISIPGGGTGNDYPCNGLTLQGFISTADFDAAEAQDSWGWTDPMDGKEYAVVALDNGTAFVDISNPIAPKYLGRMDSHSGGSNLWRDVKVYNNHAFVVSEVTADGLQVFNLAKLRGLSASPTGSSSRILTEDAFLFIGDGGSNDGRAHNIVINEDSGFAYIVGVNRSSNSGGGPIFVNIQDPLNPVIAGEYGGNDYFHDAQVLTYNGPDLDYSGRELMIGANENEIVIVDVTNKSNPTNINTISYPGVHYTHQGWFTEDLRFFILGDEEDEIVDGGGTRTLVFDFEDLDNPSLYYTYNGPTPAIDHNGYIKGNRFYLANYAAGTRILKISGLYDPVPSMTEVAFMDTYQSSNSASFNGIWNVYPFFESGNIFATGFGDANVNGDGGLFIMRDPNYDDTPPTAVCNGYTATLDKNSGNVTITAADLDGDSTDNIGIVKSTISGQTTFTCADVGQTFNVTLEVEDDYGLKSTCVMAVTVEAEATQYTGGDISNNASWTNGLPGLGSDARITSNATLTTTSSIDACTCSVDNSQTLTINANAYLKTEKDITVNGSLIVEHQGSVVQTDPTAQVIKGPTAVINVNNTTPFLKPRDFMIMGSPMTAETRTGVYTNAFLVLEFHPENFEPAPDLSAQGTNFADADGDYFSVYNTGNINPTEGFIVRPQASYTDGNQTYNITHALGTLNSGTITRPIAFNTAPINNPDGTPNVVANPYASGMSATAFLAQNPSVEAIYFWEHITPPDFNIPGNVGLRFDMDDVSILNATGGLKAASDNTMPADPNHTKPNDIISTSQGFSFFANGSATDLTFTNAMRITGENNTLTRPIGVNRIWLDLRVTEYPIGSSTLLAFNPAATSGIDYGYDTNRLATIVSLYSLTEDDQHKLSIQTTTEFTETREIKLGFSSQVEENLEFTISIDEFDGVEFEDTTIYLIDTYEAITTNLTEVESYTFRSGKITLDDRFILRFTPNQILSNEDPLASEIIVYPNPTKNLITINSPSSFLEKIEIYDVRGRRMIQEIEEEQHTFSVNLATLETSIYFLRITTATGTVTKKIIKE